MTFAQSRTIRRARRRILPVNPQCAKTACAGCKTFDCVRFEIEPNFCSIRIETCDSMSTKHLGRACDPPLPIAPIFGFAELLREKR